MNGCAAPSRGQEVEPVSSKTKPDSAWDRSAFAMTSEELDIHEAVNALSRLLRAPWLHPDTVQAVHLAFERLTAERESIA